VSHPGDRITLVDVAELRERAKQEIAEIGPQPNDPREHYVWSEEWRGAAVLLAGSPIRTSTASGRGDDRVA
jgi:hypothetical protein